jgi:tricorn protease-like protein
MIRTSAFSARTEFSVTTPQKLVSNLAVLPYFDISPDGKKILMPRLSQQGNQSVTLVTNFTEGLKK